MSAIEFSAHADKDFSVQLYGGINNLPSGDPVAAVESVPGRYRATFVQEGIAYVVATATNLLVSGYANLSKPGINGYSELLETYDEAAALNDVAEPPPVTDLQPKDVRAGVLFLDSNGNQQTGTLELPNEDQVLEGVGYGDIGTEIVGTLVAATSEEEGAMVLANGQIRSPLVIGANYVRLHGKGFTWRVRAPSGLVPGDIIAHFRGRKVCSVSSGYNWDSIAQSVTAVVIGGVTYWDLTFDLTDEQTILLTEGIYRWWVIAETVSGDLVLKQFSVYSPLKFQLG